MVEENTKSVNRSGLIIAAVVLVAIAVVVLFPRLGIDFDGAEGKVNIAINVPLTGPIAGWSGQFANGFLMGLEDACKEYGLDMGTFSVDIQDNAGDNAQAVSIFAKQKLRKPDVYITVATGPALAIADQVDAIGVPHFIASFDPFITRPGPNRHRIMANSKLEAPIFVDYAISQSAQKVYIIQLNLAYAEQQMGQMVEPRLREHGIEVIRELYNIEERDFKTLSAKVASANPDLIFVVGYSFHLQPLLRDLRTSGLVKRGSIVTVQDLVDLVYNDTPIAELRDIYFISPFFDIDGAVPGAPEWRARFKNRFGTRPTYVPAYAYDNAYVLVKSLAESGRVDKESIRDALPIQGIAGKIDLDSDRDIKSTVALAVLDGGRKVVRVK